MREMIPLVLIFLALVIIVGTLLPLLRVGEWWVRIFDFPRLQLFLIGAFLTPGLGYLVFSGDYGFGKWVFMALIACLIYQGYRIYPYTVLAHRQSLDSINPGHEDILSILTANVYMKNRNASGFLDLVSTFTPDMVLVIEPDTLWERQLTSLEATYPFTIKQALENTYGMLLYSRLKLRSPDIRFLIDPEVPSFFSEIELPSGKIVEFYGLHPRPPRFGQDTVERDAEILMIGRDVAHGEKPVVVTGDLNDVAWSYKTGLFQRISGLVDPRIGRGFFNTFHAKYPIFRFPVDHIFHSRSFRLVEMRRLPSIGSDHFPILAILSYEPDRPDPEPSVADSEDRKQARELIKKGKK